VSDPTPTPLEIIQKSLDRAPSNARTARRILIDLERAGYVVREQAPTPLNERIVLIGRDMREWFTAKSDAILDRIQTSTTQDVMLYHDAVGVLVAARQLVELTAQGTLEGELTPEQQRALSGEREVTG
jgi:hypothetical protein